MNMNMKPKKSFLPLTMSGNRWGWHPLMNHTRTCLQKYICTSMLYKTCFRILHDGDALIFSIAKSKVHVF